MSKELPEIKSCTYCGFASDLQREHVIPVVWLGYRSMDTDKQWIVVGCRQCNMFAGANVFFSIPDKAEFIKEVYKRKFKKIINIPQWTEHELSELSYRLKVGVEQSLMLRDALKRRLNHLDMVSNYDSDFMRPKWMESQIRQLIEEQKIIWKKREKQRKLKLKKLAKK